MRTATGGQLIGERQIAELPLQGRRPERLMYLAAGTVDLGRNACRICGQGGVYPGEETAGVNGTGQGQVQFQLDATSHNDTYLNTSLPFPNPDAVQEFNLQSSNFTANGHAGGGIVNVSSSPARTTFTHRFTFSVTARNARQFFAPTQDTLKRNQSGGSIGGPIFRNKLFYFATFQGRASAARRKASCNSCRPKRSAAALLVHLHAPRRSGHTATARQQPDSADRISPIAKISCNTFLCPTARVDVSRFPALHGRIDNQLMGKVDYVLGQHQFNGATSSPIMTSRWRFLTISGGPIRRRLSECRTCRSITFTGSPTLLFSSTFGMVRQRGGSLSTAPFGMNAAGSGSSVRKITRRLIRRRADRQRHRRLQHRYQSPRRFRSRISPSVMWRPRLPAITSCGSAARRSACQSPDQHVSDGRRVAFNGQLSGNGTADFMFGRSSEFRQGGGEFKDLKGTRWGFFIQDNWSASSAHLEPRLRWDPYLSA
jgi:hypothetical protein